MKADVFDNHTVSGHGVKRKNNKNVQLLILLSVSFRTKHVKKENNSDFKRQLSWTFSKNTFGRMITYKYKTIQDIYVFALSYFTINGSRTIAKKASVRFMELRQRDKKLILRCDAV